MLEPPYGVLAAGDEERMMADKDTWLIPVTILYVTHMNDTETSNQPKHQNHLYTPRPQTLL